MKNNIINIANCEFFAFLTASVAKYLKNPTSSNTTLKKTIDINKTNISRGFTLEFSIILKNTTFASTNPKIKRIIAPRVGANQNVCISKFLIFKTGHANTHTIIPSIDNIDIIIAGITI